MTPEYVLGLSDPRSSLGLVGGKGASLARLSEAGLPVPAGFHITTEAYGQFVTENGLQPQILAALEGIDLTLPSTLEDVSCHIQALFAAGQMPSGVAHAIVDSYAGLAGQDPAVAVRSSATAEDLPEASFAGQQETYLNVSGASAVLEATKKCWASLWTGRAIAYRARRGIGPDGIALAVVVQMLVPAEAAGILFTANPVNGRRDQAVISAAWGLGEAVVGGLVTPDMITVDKSGLQVLHRETADKQTMTVRVNGGTAEHPVPRDLRRVPVLDDDDVRELVGLGLKIEAQYGYPMDIEWARADGRFAILQARPITALPEPDPAPPAQWVMPDPKGKYYRGSVVDFLPDPVSPLFLTLGLEAMNGSLLRLLVWMTGRPDSVPADFLTTINGYAYVSAGFTPGQMFILLVKMLPKFPGLLRTGEARWRDEALPHYTATVAPWEERPVHQIEPLALLAGAEEIFEAAADYLVTLQSGTMGGAGGSEFLFTSVYDRLVRRAGDPPAPTFLLGYDSTPILAEKGLYDLADWCRERGDLAAYLAGTPAGAILAQMGAGEAPAGIDHDGWTEWRQRFDAHLRRFGHSIYDLDFAKPLPAEDPAPILEALKLFVAGQGRNPYERQGALAERREAAVREALGRLRGLRRKAFLKTLGWAQWLAPLREDGIAGIGLGYPTLRRLLLELGSRFVANGMILAPADIFYLEKSEVREAAAALERGESLEGKAELVAQRRAALRAAKRVTPPPQLPPKARIMGLDMEKFQSARDDNPAEGKVVKGLGASPGRVTAVARVLHGPEDFSRMRPGDVLVAPITTPAWTPLFAMASAIVTDIGGPLSHGSIVAREYGIPAVLGTGIATRRIRNGQTITVDGNSGTVTLDGGEN